MPCGIDTSDPQGLELTMLASTGRTALCQALIAMMRHRALANAPIAVARITTRLSAILIFLPTLGSGSADTVLDKIQALSTTRCSCAMNHYLQFGDG